MPELPEVETIRRGLEPLLIGAVVIDADAHPSAKFAEAVEIVGTSIESISRRGKYLLFSLDDGRELVAHLGMTGSFRVDAIDGSADVDYAMAGPHVRAVWRLDDDRELRFRDIRRFGRLRVVEAGEYRTIATLSAMGPEPFDEAFSGRTLHEHAKRSSRAIKTLLLSQRPVAGVGNIYADEALFLAGIDPRSRRVGRERCERLADTIRQVLRAGIDNGGTTLRDYVDADGTEGANQHQLLVYGRAGEPCVTCGTTLSACIIDARSTTLCANCQKR